MSRVRMPKELVAKYAKRQSKTADRKAKAKAKLEAVLASETREAKA